MNASDAICRGSWSLGNNCRTCSQCRETMPPVPPLMDWMICCNDSHGNFDGENVENLSFDLGPHLIELEGPGLMVRWCKHPDEWRLAEKEYRHAPRLLKVYGMPFRLPVFRLRTCVGNIFWDSIAIPVSTSVRFANWLRGQDWNCLSAPSELFGAWDERGTPITEELLEACAK